MLTRVTKRIRNTRGSSFLTHGSDDYDHKGLTKARRALDKALIAEQIEDAHCAFQTPKPQTSFRLVLWTQEFENHAAQDWNGEGECPENWSPKGGSEYHLPVGSVQDILTLGKTGVASLAIQAARRLEVSNNYYSVNVVGWALFPSSEETPGETDQRLCPGYTVCFPLSLD